MKINPRIVTIIFIGGMLPINQKMIPKTSINDIDNKNLASEGLINSTVHKSI